MLRSAQHYKAHIEAKTKAIWNKQNINHKDTKKNNNNVKSYQKHLFVILWIPTPPKHPLCRSTGHFLAELLFRREYWERVTGDDDDSKQSKFMMLVFWPIFYNLGSTIIFSIRQPVVRGIMCIPPSSTELNIELWNRAFGDHKQKCNRLFPNLWTFW